MLETHRDAEGRPRPAAPHPRPQRLGLLAALRAIDANPITFFAEDAYRDPIVEYAELGGLLLVNDPELICEIYRNKSGAYVKSNQYRRALAPALGRGLLTAEGDIWQSTRRVAAAGFGPRAIAELCDRFCDLTEAMVGRWAGFHELQRPVDLPAEFLRLTYEIISGTTCSGGLDDDRSDIQAAMARYFETVGRLDVVSVFNLPDWIPTLTRLRARPAVAAFRKAIGQAVDKRIDEGGGEVADLLDRLIGAQTFDTGAIMSRELISDNIATFVAAGHDTTGNALTWIIYLLALHPDVESRVLDEVTQVFGHEAPSGDKLDRLVYTKAVVHEGLRLYPPAPINARQPIAEVDLGGRRIKPGRPIIIAPWVVHRHAALWAEPDFFMPERFLPSAAKDIRRGAFIPFGLGPRICIGMEFALQEILLVLAIVLPRFRFRLADPDAVFPEMRVTLRPRGGLPAYLAPRR